MYGSVPSLAVTVADPLALPLQLISVLLLEMLKAEGWVIVALCETVELHKSVTSTV